MLAVVNEQQDVPAAELIGQHLEILAAGPATRLEHGVAAHPDPGQHRRADLGRFGDRFVITPVSSDAAATGATLLRRD
ncbi:hypothetical protein ACTI_66750 [Actinoplanes sp. OR16]|nr:hypothetical protein ACTI_66750 [Actinoplanes sp. OR16]